MLTRLSKRMSRKFIKRLLIPIMGLFVLTNFMIPVATEILTELVHTFFGSLLDAVTSGVTQP